MERISIRSTNIKEVGYEAESSTLEIMFTDGHVYQYFDVPAAIFDGLVNASSAGKFFHSKIRDVFRFRQVRG